MFDIFWIIIYGSLALLVVLIGYGILYYFYNKIINYFSNKKKLQHNTIPIVHSNESNILKTVLSSNGTMINTNTHMDFLKTYETLDKTKDIYVVMHTKGGSLSSAEAIINCIINHTSNITDNHTDNHTDNRNGKIICVIPYYAYSAGCCIALCCDKIIMHKNAIVGPCDAQLSNGLTSSHSVASIVYAVEHKKEKNEKIEEKWLASSYDAELCKKRQREFMNKLVKHNKYTQETADKIYEEFFSGKYNHDQVFSAEDLIDLGVNVEVVDNIDKNIRCFL